MPLTAKGEKILENMREHYGSEAKAKEVFYASANAGTITGVHDAMELIASTDIFDATLNWASGNHEFYPSGPGDTPTSQAPAGVSGVDAIVGWK